MRGATVTGLRAEAHHDILVAWNDTAAPLPAAAGVHELVEAQVDRTPDAVAAEIGDARLSYRALDEHANRVAHRLQSLGVGPDVLVGVCVERSLAAVTAILGVLKAGGAYVPLDPAYPRQRLGFMLEDAAIRVLLTTRALLPSLPEVAAHVVCLDDDLSAEPSARPARAATPESLAYVIYTSGSTGRSKGVAMPHGPLLNLIAWQQRSHAFPGAARTLGFASMSFDVSFQELFSTWSTGGALILAPEDARRDPPALARLLAEREVERAFLPPVVLQHLAEAVERRAPLPARLREIITAGEALQITAPIAALLARLGGCALQNHYGPTETHVVTAYSVPTPALLGAPPIGKPIANTRVYLLDERLAPVPVGAIGELYIGGAALARGYLGRPELTAERFIVDPFDATRHGRLYKTGDRCRFLPDGALEFHGRVDHQVKLRGYRIELGEIEAALLAHPAVRRAGAAVREDAPGQRRLVAYVVAMDPSAPPAADELRRHLAATLPEYMIPAAIATIDELPLLPSGKLDRAALPAPEAGGERAFAGPRTPVEEVLAAIFADVLRVDRVGIDDDFFALGGHSLLATQAPARAGAALAVGLPAPVICEAPTVARLAERAEEALRSGARPAAPRITARPREGAPPLSFTQEGIWLFDRLVSGSAAYNIPLALRLGGAIDAGAIEQSLARIVRRHEALRTTFVTVDGEPRQAIAAESTFTMPSIDLASLPEDAREAEAARRAAEEAARPFDLARGPLFRATLLRLSAEAHVLLLTMHHAVSDGWSIGVLLSELSASYAALSAGEAPALPDLPIQVADHALWQREHATGEALAPSLAYWKAHLGGAPARLDLPADRPRPAIRNAHGATHRFLIPRDASSALAVLSRREGVTLFMTLLAAFDTLLHRITGQDDIVVGSPVAGRAQVETEGLIGAFVNTLVLRASLAGDPTFRALLRRVREATLGSYTHQDLPFEVLLEELAPDRDVARAPLFEVMFVLENTPVGALSLGGASIERLLVDSGTSKADLTLFLEETERGIEGALEYATDLFDAATIARMAGHFQVLVEGVVTHPDKRLSELPLLTPEERRTLLVTWNDTRAPYPRDAAVHALFEAQVDRAPDAVALLFGDTAITYRELDQRANRLARVLRARGVGPETPVGLYLRRSPELVIAILAVLKAGGAYVPLDPGHPPARLSFLLGDAGIEVVVSGEPLHEATVFPAGSLVRADEAWSDGSDERIEGAARGDSLAYVMYTSGSTGAPKGVCVVHRGITRLVTGAAYAHFGPDTVFLLLANPAFDASTFEIWGALLHGGRLAIMAEERPSPAEIAAEIRRCHVTTLWLTAGLFHAVMDTHPEALRPLGQLLIGGDVLSVPHVQEARRALPGVTLINGYGPTEGTTFSCCFTITEAEGTGSIPIGKPIANTVAHVLDTHLSPVPVGVAGELYIGGDGLSRGYLNRPELTAERFIRDPFSDEAGDRLYRTGDLARRLGSGDIEFLGRADAQLKIRGYRIEPGEIEAALASHPAVRASVLMAREDTPGDKRLTAYVVADQDAVSASALYEHLGATLPDYMVPSAFVVLDALPLTPQGKVDKSALPRPEAGSGQEHGYVAPRTLVEEVLAGLWAEVLGLDRVGVHDDFFSLGGHSLLGTRVIARLYAAFGVELPLRVLFEAKTLGRLADRIEAARRSGARPAATPITPRARGGPPPLSFAQQRLWLVDRIEPNLAVYNIPRATRLDGPLDVRALERSLVEIVRRHEALRTTFVTIDGEPRQLIAAEPSFTLPVIDLEAMPGEARESEARRLTAEEASTPFDLSEGPLFRATLLRLGERSHILLTTSHHSVSDGWSESVLARELSALYEALSASQPSPLQEPTLQYADYAVWQRQWLSGDALSAQLAYWREQLSGAPTLIDLPSDRPRPARPTYGGATHLVKLSGELSAALEASSRREGVTLFMTLLATLEALLHLYSGQDDILVGSPIAARTRAEIEALMGFFANTLVLRADFSLDPTFRDLLARTRDVTLDAYDHQDMPFERLVEELRVERDLSHNPLFQVMLVLQNTPPTEIRLGGLTAAAAPVEMTTTRFDLLFDVTKVEEQLDLSVTYSTDLYDAPTIAQMTADLVTLLGRFAADAGQPISAARAWISRRTLDIAVVATFTAEPIEDTLALWTRELGVTGRIRFAPYGQVFQQLLDPTSLLGRNGDGANVILVRLEDWMRGGPDDLTNAAGELGVALRSASLRCPAPHVVVICPPSPSVLAQPDRVLELRRLEISLASTLADARGVHVITSAQIADVYPVSDVHDPRSDSAGHVPYTPLYFAALGTAVVRRLSATLGAPYKVIVADCDQTLWKGIVGEVGVAGVEVDPPRRALQELLLAQRERGMLLCLCSKNNEADVLEVFERGPEMPLRMDHVLAHRINWRPKSENLVSLAAELGLGLDSFVFVDDDPRERAEVKARCPEVLTVEIPSDSEQIPHVLRHVWAFDRAQRSSEDGQRTALYRENARRERLRGQAPTLAAFVASLDLRVSTSRMTSAHLERVAQLTQRTNQLNVTTRRRTESDLQQRLSSGELVGLITEVRDRFGDYGLVGCVLFAAAADALRVDTFLLSCRVLGRGVEVQMLVSLGEIARERGLRRIEIDYRPTKKNKPALELLGRVGHAFESGTADGSRFDLPTPHVLSLDSAAYLSQPEIASPSVQPVATTGAESRPAFVVPDDVPTSLDRAEKVLEKARSRRAGQRGTQTAYLAPSTPVEDVLAGIWADLLGVDRVGVHDDFFAAGGHSLLGTRLLSRVGAAFSVDLPLRALFEAPTVSRLAERIESAGKGSASTATPPLVPQPREGPPPLSFAQQRLWLLDKLEPGQTTYNTPAPVRLQGPLDTGALERSLAEIVRRHEALRTTFVTVGGEPRQAITASQPFTLPVLDLASLPDQARAAEAERLTAEDAQRPFDLARGPLFRATLLRLGPEAHALLLTMHHVVTDGWSIGVLMQELSTLYEAFTAGRPSPLPELPIQYADYAVWQRAWLSGEVLEGQLAYWREQLRGAPAALDLPTDRPRPAAESHRGGSLSFCLPKRLSTGLVALGRREGVTLFMTLLAAFQVLLQRYSGQDDIVVGSPIAGRTRVETESLIGFFVNTLVLRTRLDGEPTFRDLSARVREGTLGAHAHQDVPFEKLVEELAPARDRSRSPLFQVMFILQNAPGAAGALGAAHLTRIPVSTTMAMFDLTLSAEETTEGLACEMDYATDLFDAATIARMAGHFQVLIEGFVADPERRVSELPLLTERERVELATWNDTAADYPRDATLHGLFAAQAARTPAAIALRFGDQEISYGEIAARASRRARRLAALGVGPGGRVGIYLDRSPEMVIGLLGILGAGGAWVPLDPAHPQGRIAFVIEDAHLAHIVTDGRLSATLPVSAARVVLADDGDARDPHDTHDRERASAHDVAYVIYTSGSTGRPKGVLGTHRNAVNRFAWMWRAHPFQPGEVACLKTTLSFVDSIWEIFGPLLAGVPSVILADETVKDVPRFVDALARGRVTRLVLVPSLLRAMLDLTPDLDARLPALQRWTSSGEALPADLASRFLRAMPGRVLHNLYGSSEVAADATCFEAAGGFEGERVPIGKPIANVRAYVLDAHRREAPIGVPGELHVGGDGVALGYLDRPELTAARFMADPFSGTAGARMFRTGDICRRLANGDLDHLGRADHQVKLRGHRIELGEIEGALATHPGVRQALVTMRAGDLVAYVVARDSAHLREHLASKLPTYMIPAAIVALDGLPLLPNGKVDHGALPAPERRRSAAAGKIAGPVSACEAELLAIWRELLPGRPIGVRDDFFELGGHSLLAARMFHLIAARFGKDLPLAVLFQAPTIKALARVVEGKGGGPTWSSLVPVQALGSRRPFFCVHAIGGNVVGYGPLARELGADQPFYALQSRGLDGAQAPHERVEDMAAHYLAEIRSVQPRGPYALGGSSSGGIIALEMAQQLRAAGERVDALILLDTHVIGLPRESDGEATATSALHTLRAAMDRHVRRLRLISPPEARAYVRAHVEALFTRLRAWPGPSAPPGPPRAPEPELAPALRRVREANFQALSRYVMRPYPAQATLLLAVEEAGLIRDRRLAWADVVTGGLSVRFISGNHDTMLARANAQAAALALTDCLAARGQ